MNEASEWRLALAQQIAPVYAANSNVQAVAVIGSVSRGCADRFSDIELGIFWSRPPSEGERQLAVERLDGTGWQPSPFNDQIEAWEEEYYLHGVKIDLGHFVTETFERLMADVVERHDTSLSRQTSVSAIQCAIPLRGAALIEAWQAKVAQYPEPLARAMVTQHLSFGPCWTLEMLADRDEFLLLHHNLCANERRILLLLTGLNRTYYPGHKWIHRLISEMRILPRDLSPRLQRVLRGDLAAAVTELRALIEETFALVDLYMPEVETAGARERLRQQPHRWEQPPPEITRAGPAHA